ncbi:uncharacterized protein LAESUDRAFT_161676 [Laetiporus sulphureus 93-53]|uniref:Protein YAE1 n=1 Tax=Laetiporus sulphureus 93-53 TaxID=1314785 RepID=A0A165HNS0_9APHY|nr:uncharacterized protein LAESUDRAFT_161676 [Laetiporus sulphureus 93-53]KZT11982.1 hypothetical protein LAESUDRAFT_161676 [Laetiporus sulphureus 93-53]
MEDEVIWQDDPKVLQESEWSRLSSNFTTAGYREGITAGKESALQQGFNEGFAEVGVPLGREIGILRGMASALLSYLTAAGDKVQNQTVVDEARNIVSQLSAVRFSDIAPPDLEAERHARDHLEAAAPETIEEMEVEMNEELKEKQDLESLEDMLVRMSAGGSAPAPARKPSVDDVRRLKERLLALSEEVGLSLQWS